MDLLHLFSCSGSLLHLDLDPANQSELPITSLDLAYEHDELIIWNTKFNRSLKKGTEHMHWDRAMHLMLDK